MSLSRTPSPIPGGGWAAPGLNVNSSGRTTPSATFATSNRVQWEESSGPRDGHATFSTQNRGFFTRHIRRISNSLPIFVSPPADFEKKPQQAKLSRFCRLFYRLPIIPGLFDALCGLSRKAKIRFFLVLTLVVSWIAFYNSRECLLGCCDASSPNDSLRQLACIIGGGESVAVIISSLY